MVSEGAYSPLNRGCTLPQTHIAPENGPGPKKETIRIPTIHFQVRTVSFRGGVLQMIVEIKQDVILFNLLLFYINSAPV